MLKKIHLWVGIIGMLLFFATGLYFRLALDGLQNLEASPRLLLRTSHVYLFFGCFINLIFGLYYNLPEKVRWYTVYNQSLVIVAPLLFGYGFLFESFDNTGIDRPVGTLGAIALFAWLFNTCAGRLYLHWKAS